MPNLVSKSLSSSAWREVVTTIVKDINSLVVQVSDGQGSRRGRGEELLGGAGSHLMYGGRQGSCHVRVWEKLWEWVVKDVYQKRWSWGEQRLASCLYTGALLRVTHNNWRSPLCCWPSGHRQTPGERSTCLQLPCHSCPFTNSQVNYLQRQKFP